METIKLGGLIESSHLGFGCMSLSPVFYKVDENYTDQDGIQAGVFFRQNIHFLNRDTTVCEHAFMQRVMNVQINATIHASMNFPLRKKYKFWRVLTSFANNSSLVDRFTRFL